MCVYLMESVCMLVFCGHPIKYIQVHKAHTQCVFVYTCAVYLLACACIPVLQSYRVCLPVQVNFLEGVVSSSLSVMSPGPAQRAMPGSL